MKALRTLVFTAVAASAAANATLIFDFDNQLGATTAPVLDNRWAWATIDTATSGQNRNVGRWDNPNVVTSTTNGNPIRVVDQTITFAAGQPPARANQSNALNLRWSFTGGLTNGEPNQSTNAADTWLRAFTDFGASPLRVPAIDITKPLSIDIYTVESLRITLVLRESDLTGISVGQSGPLTGQIEVVGGPVGGPNAVATSGNGRGGFVVPAGQWTTITWDLPNTANLSFRGITGNNVLASLSGNNLVGLSGFGFAPLDGEGLLQKQHNVWIDNIRNAVPPAGITGSVTLNDWNGAVAGQNLDIEILDSSNASVETGTATLDSSGNFTYVPTASLADGSYTLLVKASHWLRKGASVAIAGNAGAAGSFSLTNGDVDGDNSVTIFDYIDLSGSFDLFLGDAGYLANADLDGDDSVTIFDYIILSNNFDITGD